MAKRRVPGWLLGVISAVLAIAFVGLCYGISSNVRYHDSLTQTNKRLKRAESTANIDYGKHQTAINNQAMATASKSTDPILTAVALHNNTYGTVSNVAKQFFTTYYTWSDTASYLARASKLSAIITPGLAANKTVFDEGKDATGGDYIKTTGLHSQFVGTDTYVSQADGDIVQALVKVTNKSWYKDKVDAAGQAVHYYKLTYDKSAQRVSDLSLVLSQSTGGN